MKPIATGKIDEINYYSCTVCKAENVVLVVEGGVNCNYCGNGIALCKTCAQRMVEEAGNILARAIRKD